MYKIVVSPAAEKQIKKLTKREQTKVIKRIAKLAERPLPPSVKKLQGANSLFRVRQGDWRIIYTIENKKLTVLIVKVGHRREVYQ
ncbi:MAG: type II toxin-antitoxin system RelE/ParE family toxin [Candidatus Algichlamydia australiensis]|nr:type II toxin-antitoxin system RelE/ParE family toxin [Chlamydiales bacterium]